MPTIFTHAFIGLAASKLVLHKKRLKLFIVLSVLLPIMPDLDVIGFRLGIDYDHWLGHRGFFHSPFFAALAGLLVTGLFFRKESPVGGSWLTWGYFTLIISSHGLLDAMTNGGLGVALASPFSHERYFLPVTPIEVSPLTMSAFFSEWGWRVIISELKFVWLPIASVISIAWYVRRSKYAK